MAISWSYWIPWSCHHRSDRLACRDSLGELEYNQVDFTLSTKGLEEDFTELSDHFIIRMYEFIRDQVAADEAAGTRLVGIPARHRADSLLAEINRRGLYCRPIDWPPL